MPILYPVMLNLDGRTCVIVGGGAVAARKVQGLLAANARITVMSPQLHPTLAVLSESGQITTHNSRYTSGMLADLNPLLVFAATDDPAVNQQIAAEARSLGALVNVADEQGERDFINMAAVQRGCITIALSSAGAAPALLTHLHYQIEALIGEEYTILVGWMAESRPRIQTHIASQQDRASVWRRVLESSILDKLRQGDTIAARQYFDQLIQEAIDNPS